MSRSPPLARRLYLAHHVSTALDIERGSEHDRLSLLQRPKRKPESENQPDQAHSHLTARMAGGSLADEGSTRFALSFAGPARVFWVNRSISGEMLTGLPSSPRTSRTDSR